MKKALSVLLAVMMIVVTCAPAFAATTTYEVTFENNMVNNDDNTVDWYDGYAFVNSVDGEIQYVQDDHGIYVYYAKGGVFTTWDDLFDYNKPDKPVWYSPDVLMKKLVPADETITFQLWSMKYNLATAAVTVNGKIITPDKNGEYTVTVTENTTIAVVENYPGSDDDVLLRNHYEVQLSSGDGFKCKPLSGVNYSYVYYGDDFYFRVKIDEGYTGSGMTVGVTRGIDILTEYLEEDADLLLDALGKTEPLVSYGVDSEGYRLYKIENITSDCRIVVNGVEEESDGTDIMSLLMRILRFILNIFGIKMDILDDLTAYYNVGIFDESDLADCEVYLGSEDYSEEPAFTVSTGQGIVVKVTKEKLDDKVSVTWEPGNEKGAYQTDWYPELDENGNTVYTAVYYIDNIETDTYVYIK